MRYPARQTLEVTDLLTLQSMPLSLRSNLIGDDKLNDNEVSGGPLALDEDQRKLLTRESHAGDTCSTHNRDVTQSWHFLCTYQIHSERE